MKFRECTEKYIDLKKLQYYETAKDVEFVMRQAGLQNNNEGFEIAKEMILNNEGCSKKNMALYVLFELLKVVLNFCKECSSFVLAILTAFIINNNNLGFINTKLWIEIFILVFIICFFIVLVNSVFEVNKNKLDILNIRILKNMSFERYQYVLKNFISKKQSKKTNITAKICSFFRKIMKIIKGYYMLIIIMVIVLGVFFAVSTSCKCFDVGNNIFDGIQALGTITAILFTARQIRKERLMNEKEQASCISCWISKEYLTDKPSLRNVEILNSSKQPIYNVVVSIDGIHYDDKTVDNINDKISYVQIVPPGHYYVFAQHSGGGMHMQFSASISFTDASGRYWYRDAWGKLKQKEHDVFGERKISLPVEPCSINKISD